MSYNRKWRGLIKCIIQHYLAFRGLVSCQAPHHPIVWIPHNFRPNEPQGPLGKQTLVAHKTVCVCASIHARNSCASWVQLSHTTGSWEQMFLLARVLQRLYQLIILIKTLYYPTDAHVYTIAIIIKYLKISKIAPTCFGSQGIHHLGALYSAWLKLQ